MRKLLSQTISVIVSANNDRNQQEVARCPLQRRYQDWMEEQIGQIADDADIILAVFSKYADKRYDKNYKHEKTFSIKLPHRK